MKSILDAKNYIKKGFVNAKSIFVILVLIIIGEGLMLSLIPNSFLFLTISIIISIACTYGLYTLALNIVRGGKSNGIRSRLKAIKKDINRIAIVGVMITVCAAIIGVVGAIILIPFISNDVFSIVPLIIASIIGIGIIALLSRYIVVTLFVLIDNKEVRAIEALKESFPLVHKLGKPLFWIELITATLAFLPSITLVMIPALKVFSSFIRRLCTIIAACFGAVTLFAQAHIYEDMIKATSMEGEELATVEA